MSSNEELARGLNGLIQKSKAEQVALERTIMHHATETAAIGMLMRVMDASDVARADLHARLAGQPYPTASYRLEDRERAPLALEEQFAQALDSTLYEMDEQLGRLPTFLTRQPQEEQPPFRPAHPQAPHGPAPAAEHIPHYGPRPASVNPMRRSAA